MHSKQNYPATFERNRPLKGDLPKILVESQDDPAIPFGAFEQRAIFQTWTIGSCPQNVVFLIA